MSINKDMEEETLDIIFTNASSDTTAGRKGQVPIVKLSS